MNMMDYRANETRCEDMRRYAENHNRAREMQKVPLSRMTRVRFMRMERTQQQSPQHAMRLRHST